VTEVPDGVRVANADELTLDVLTAGISVFQRRTGHRFSSDDLVTAWLALQVCPAPARALDLGCGLGSVLLHVAWSAPAATLVGVEVQDVSFALLERNVAHNALGDRVRVHHGDLRDPAVVAVLDGPFDLVTGTPPYFPADTATAANDDQRAYARIEHRGGIEAYVGAAARVLATGGWFVVCADADASRRLHDATADHGLAVCRRCSVVPRAGRAPLFTVWALRHAADAGDLVASELTLRDAAGERTADAKMLRAFSGLHDGARVSSGQWPRATTR
jgi:tRNA1Val (adenine37-N6)-methyltransferase